ncbi:MAG: hypothetical protein ACP5FK_10450 [bacterium]
MNLFIFIKLMILFMKQSFDPFTLPSAVESVFNAPRVWSRD